MELFIKMPGRKCFNRITEEAAMRLYFARHLTGTLSMALTGRGGENEIQMPQESLMATFWLLSELLAIEPTGCPPPDSAA